MITADLQPYPSRVPEESNEESDEILQERSKISLWQDRIKSAKLRWKPDFDRMKKNMEFVTGLQWTAQTTIDDERYTNNLTLRLVSQKVASLYAKNPTATATRRERLDYALWDGTPDALMGAMQQAQMELASGQPLSPEISALMEDIQQGREHEEMVQKVCDTLRILYQYYVDSHKPEFKESFKQLVRRVIICGVGYVRPILCIPSSTYAQPSSIDSKADLQTLIGRIHALTASIQEDAPDTSSAAYSTLRSLAASLGVSQQEEASFIQEKLEFDFPSATSVIPDERCRSLKDFTDARWIAIQYILPVEEVNAIFNVDVKVGTGEGGATEHGVENAIVRNQQGKSDPQRNKMVCLYEILDYTTKQCAYIAEGWKDWVKAPEYLWPQVSGFWNIIPLTFNDIEVESDTKASIFPPSDVQTVKHPQKEWNRTREALRDHRNANAPKYFVRKGMLTEEDKNKLINAQPNSVIELEGIPPDQPIQNFIVAFQHSPVDPALYDVAPLEQDILNGSGMQQANLGPAQPNVTATVGTIAEQSRLNVSASNIDDLDGCLTRLAQMSGEMMFQGISADTVKRIVGPGAVFPTSPESRMDFLNEVYLKIVAASSGRPNKAIDVQNATQILPLIQQAGGNPIGVIQELAHRLDDNIDPLKFFPLSLPQGPSSNVQGGPGNPPLTSPEESGNNPSSNGLDDGSTAPAAGLESPSNP